MATSSSPIWSNRRSTSSSSIGRCRRNGLEITRLLRNAGSQIPILMMSGAVERTRVLEAVRSGVTDFLVKPFEPGWLRAKIEHFLGNHAVAETSPQLVPTSGTMPGRVDSPKRSSGFERDDGSKLLLTEVLRQIDEVSTIPEMAAKFLEAANDPNAQIDDLADVLSRDPALTTRVLRLVNSSAFGIRERVTNLPHAVMYLGLKQVRNLAVAVSVSDLFRVQGRWGPIAARHSGTTWWPWGSARG